MWASAHVSRPPKSPTKMGFDEVSAPSLQVWGRETGGPPLPGTHSVHPLRAPTLRTHLPRLLQVFVISLARRPDRRERMLSSLWEMDISGRVVDAVDGR